MKTILFSLLCLISLAPLSQAQFPDASRVDTGLSVGGSHGLGYDGVKLASTSRVLVSASPRIAPEFRFDYLFRSHKYTGDGSGVVFETVLHGRIFDNLSLDGGVAVRHQSTRLFSKTSAGPTAGASYWFRSGRIGASYEADLSSENRIRAVNVLGEGIWRRQAFYLALRPEVGFARFTQVGAGRLTGTDYRLSVSVGKVIDE